MLDKPHKRLEAWRLSYEFAKEIYSATKDFPPDERFGMTSQIRRAAVSIPVNIAEGAGRKSPKEFSHFLSIALGSLAELDTLIQLAGDLSFLSPNVCIDLLNKLNTIGKLIYGLSKSLAQKFEK